MIVFNYVFIKVLNFHHECSSFPRSAHVYLVLLGRQMLKTPDVLPKYLFAIEEDLTHSINNPIEQHS